MSDLSTMRVSLFGVVLRNLEQLGHTFLSKKNAQWKLHPTAMQRCYVTYSSRDSVSVEMCLCGSNKMKPPHTWQGHLWKFWKKIFQDAPSHYMVTSRGRLVHQIYNLVISSFGDTWRQKSLNAGRIQLMNWNMLFVINSTAIPEVMTSWALRNFMVRLQECIAREGKHLDHTILKTKWQQ
jgi:hypothetical protein